MNQFNNATPENNNDPENISSCQYHDIDEMYNVGIPNKNKSLFLFLISACYLNKNFDDLQYLLSCIFILVGVTETRITKHLSLLNNFNLNNYSYEFAPVETTAGSTLLCIGNHLSYKAVMT